MKLSPFVVLWSALAVGLPAFAATDISDRPMLGRVTDSSIVVWARTERPGRFTVRYGTAPDRLEARSEPVATAYAHDLTGVARLEGLRPDTRYYLEVVGEDRDRGPRGEFRTLPDAARYRDAKLNPRGLFNFCFELGCCQTQNPRSGLGPGLPLFATMLRERLPEKVHFALLNGDWLYEEERSYPPADWAKQVGAAPADIPPVVGLAPPIVGVWQNYKTYLRRAPHLVEWHRRVPTVFTFDDHELVNDIRGAGTIGFRERRAVFRDIGVQAWMDYLGWANPFEHAQPIHFGRARLAADSDILVDQSADFRRLDLAQTANLHVHWGKPTAGEDILALDAEPPGDPNAGVYEIREVLDAHRLRIRPAATADSVGGYSIGRRAYGKFRVGNCEFFLLDCKSHREMHDPADPARRGLSLLGAQQKEWLLRSMRESDADFFFIASSVNFVIPHDGAGGNNRFFFSAAGPSALTLTYSAVAATREYGLANPVFNYTVSGRDDDTVAWDVTGEPQLTTTAMQESGVGQYDIDIAPGTLVSADGHYTFAFVDAQLTIERAPLIVTANDASRKLNRNNPSFSASFDGLRNSDTSAVVSGLQFSTTATINSAAGDYVITPFGGTADNYTLSFLPGTLTVGGIARLLIDADDASRLYGSANPSFTATITGFEDGEDESVVSGLQFSTDASQSSGVGLYTITPFGASAAGYEIDYDTGTLTIDRAPLTITPNSATRVYGDPNSLTATYTGLVNGDTSAVVSGLLFNTTATQASGVGTYGITLSGGTAETYAITTSGSAQLTINPAPISVRIDDKTRVFGDANPEFTFSVLGLKNGDSPASAVLFGAGPTSFAGEQADVGTYSIFGSSVVPATANYTVSSVTNGTLSVTKRPLTITADDKTKVYGDPFPTYTATFDGLAPFDGPDAITGLQFSLPAGVRDGVQTVGISVSGSTNSNYDITYRNGRLTITPAMLTLAHLPDLVRMYGRENPSTAEITAEMLGLRNDDTVASLGLGFDFPAPTADVGTYRYTPTLTNPNYAVPATGGGTFHVQPAPLTLTVNGTRRYGTVEPQLTFNAAGLAFGQDLSVLDLSGVKTSASQLPDNTGVGTWELLSEGATARNYTITHAPGRLQITPAPLLVTPLSYGFINYGEALPTFDYQLTGLVAGDSPFVLTGTRLTSYSDGLAPGDYPIAVTSPGTAANYTVTAGPAGNLNISRRPLVFAAPSLTVGSDAIPATVPIEQSLLHPDGPLFTVEGRIGSRDPTVVSLTDLRPITPTIVPQGGATMEEINRYYEITVIPGELTVTHVLKVEPIDLPPRTELPVDETEVVLLKDLTAITASGIEVLFHANFVTLMSDDRDWFSSRLNPDWFTYNVDVGGPHGLLCEGRRAPHRPHAAPRRLHARAAQAPGSAHDDAEETARVDRQPDERDPYRNRRDGDGRIHEVSERGERAPDERGPQRDGVERARALWSALGLVAEGKGHRLGRPGRSDRAPDRKCGRGARGRRRLGSLLHQGGAGGDFPQTKTKNWIGEKRADEKKLTETTENTKKQINELGTKGGKNKVPLVKNALKLAAKGAKASVAGAIVGVALEVAVEMAFVVADHEEGAKNLAAYKQLLDEAEGGRDGRYKIKTTDARDLIKDPDNMSDIDRQQFMIAMLETFAAAEAGREGVQETYKNWSYDLAPKG